jgi:ubiquinone biosynthesis protein
MLDSLFAITRDFDMQTQPHLLLLQKTMVMVEGIATSLNPDINMWDVAAPYVREWIRGELGPEAMLADEIRKQANTLKMIPDIIRRLDDQLPKKGGAPEAPPLPEVRLIWEKKERSKNGIWGYFLVASMAAAAGAAGMFIWG